ncbi:fructoselysine 6-kinase [Niallia circulans]|jgi:fructoselysine 6-kinase|uniref:fructoselysine 6-kinase n=1 Tax=Niallia circulans TaxID=1397 RepID=UPI0026EB216C|nr:fructoselysine 6-kinase [Niallia circulans]
MRKYKVIGIGDNVVDKYVLEGKMYPGGNALNFSVYAKMNNIKSAYIGKFGDDDVAEYIKAVLDELQIDYSYSKTYSGENGYAKVKLDKNERVFLGSNKGGVAKEKKWELTNQMISYISEFSLIHTSLNSYIESELKTLKSLDIPISFDFSVRWNDEYLKEVCPYIDIAFLSCSHLTSSEREREMKKAEELGADLIVGTVGENGSYALYKGDFIYQPAIIDEDVVDTMGAGDAYLTAFLIELLDQSNDSFRFKDDDLTFEVIQNAMKKGSKFAAEICKIEGAFGYGKQVRV